MYNSRNIGQDLLNVPMGDMIRDMAFAIAEAQIKLDSNSIEVAEMMGGLKTVYDRRGNVTFEDSRVFFGRDQVTFAVAKAMYATSTQEFRSAMLSTIQSETDGVSATGDDLVSGAQGPADDDLVLVPTRLSMLELGFTPTFYQFVDTIIEVKINISYTQEFSSTTEVESDINSTSTYTSASFNRHGNGFSYRGSRRTTVTTSQVNATYSTKFNYSAEGSSLLRTKLSPVPPPAILEERIRLQMELQRQREEAAQEAADE